VIKKYASKEQELGNIKNIIKRKEKKRVQYNANSEDYSKYSKNNKLYCCIGICLVA
jgi:hypothetical protein